MYVSILCCSFQDMVMVVFSCPPSLHWERHQRLRLRMAIGAVLCEFGDAPASSISSPLPPRSQVFAAFDGNEASLLLFTAVAVSGTIGYMTGYNFVASSCIEVPVANLSSWSVGYFRVVVLGNFCHDVLYFIQLPVLCASDTCPSCCPSYSP